MTLLVKKPFGTRTIVAASLVCVALFGCGGDDGDGDSSSVWDDVLPLAITNENMDAVAGSIIMADTAAFSVPLGGEIVLAGAETSSLPSPTHKLVELAVEKVKSAKSLLASQDVVSGIEGSETLPCSNEGGTVTVTFNVTSLEYLSVGDTLSFSFNNCSEIVDGILETLDGGMKLTVTFIAGDLNPYGSLGESVILTNLSLTTPSYVLTANGGMQIDETFKPDGTTDYSYSSNELTYRILIGSNTYDTRLSNWNSSGFYSVIDELDEWETTHNQAAIFPTFTGSFDVSTLMTVVEYWGEAGITAGKLQVVGSNSVLYVTFQPGNFVFLELDSDNDGDIDVSRTVPIDELNPLNSAIL
jgi:hypothetical protein